MDYRTIEWLHLLPSYGELVLNNAPPELATLLEPGMSSTGGSVATCIYWEPAHADSLGLQRFESVVLINPRRISLSVLQNAGFNYIRTFSALPALADTRWLVPLGDHSVSMSSLRMVDPWRSRDRAKKSAVSLAARLGQLRRFGDVVVVASRSKSEIERKLEDSLECSPVFLALKPGPRRTMRKTTIQVMRSDGEILAYAKMASSPDGRRVVSREVVCLRELARHPALLHAVPRVLDTHETDRSFASFLTAGPTTPGTTTFSHAHREFLLTIEASTGRLLRFADSAMWRDMQARFETLGPRLPSTWRERLAAAIRTIGNAIGSTELLLSTAHRDFGPWNTRLNSNGSLFVFDWDGARHETIPLYDVFGFHFLEYKNFSRSGAYVDVPQNIFEVCRRWMPGKYEPILPYLLLAYLTEGAMGRLIGALWRSELETDPVLAAIGRLLDEQGSWAPLPTVYAEPR